jgi:ATP-dependent DNA helicase RecQ
VGALEIAYNESSALKITPFGWRILKEGAQIQLSKPLDKKSKTPKPKKESKKAKNSSLFENLRSLRTQLAKAENVPPYIIFSDKSLKDMQNLMPTNSTAFLEVSGVGKNKAHKYGPKFMEVIAQFKSVDTKVKKSTKMVSFEMYASGLTVPEISLSRGLKDTTVLSHLVDAYAEGHHVDLASFITQAVLDEVKRALKACENPEGLKPIFEFLKEEVSYNDIRVALALLKPTRSL